MAYPFPPQFSNLPNPSEYYAKGLTLGTEVRLEREKLQNQREIVAMQAQARAQEAAASAARDQQRLMIEKAQQDAVLGLREQELRIKGAEEQRKAQEAAQSYALQQTAMAEGNARIQKGEKPETVWPAVWMKYGPVMTGSMAGMSEAFKAMQVEPPFTPTRTEVPLAGDPTKKVIYAETMKGHWTREPEEEAAQALTPGGGVQSYPVLGEGGAVLRDWRAVRSAGGKGFTALRQEGEPTSLANQRVKDLEAAYGRLWLSPSFDLSQIKSKPMQEELKEARVEYLRAKAIVDRALTAPTPGAPAVSGPRSAFREEPQYAPEPRYSLNNPKEWPRDKKGRVLVTDPNGIKGVLPEGEVPRAVTQEDPPYRIGWE